jgi:plastocyanin
MRVYHYSSTKVRKVREVPSLGRIRGVILQKILSAALLFSVGACTMSAHPVIVNDVLAVHSIVTDNMGKPLKDAVVYAMPTERMAPTKDWETVIFVENNTFQPFVLPVQTGSVVSFMNTDRVQHHIYSASPVVNFDLPLDKAESSKHIALDKAGVIVLGCAIHDGMVGYLYVMETAYFAKTGEEGTADLIDLPRGAYDVLVWHPWMKGSPDETAKRITPNAQSIATVDFVVPLQIRNMPASSPKHRGE